MSCSSSPRVYGSLFNQTPCSSSNNCCKKATFSQGAKCCPKESAVPPGWEQYTPTVTNGTPATDTEYFASYKQEDSNTLSLFFYYNQTNNTGALAGSGTYYFSLPVGYTFVTRNASSIEQVGYGSMTTNNGEDTAVYTIELYSNPTNLNQFWIRYKETSTGITTWSSATTPFTFTTILVNANIHFEINV